MSETEKFVKTGEACKKLGVCTTTLYRWSDLGYIRCKYTTGGGQRMFSVESIDFLLKDGNLLKQARKYDRSSGKNTNNNIIDDDDVVANTDEAWIQAYGSELLKARFQNEFDYEELLAEERQIKEHTDTQKLIYTALNQEGIFKNFKLVATEINSENYEDYGNPGLNEIKRLSEFKSKVTSIKNAEVKLVFNKKYQCLSYVMFRYKPDQSKSDTLDYVFLV